ncbi:MAG TPA: nucleotidyltransferase family protein [Pirellulaceae bacterium]
MTNNAEITSYRSKLRDHFPDFVRRYRVASLSLFGSRVRGDNRADSDLDILAQFRETPSLFTLLRLENELSDMLGLRVDLVMEDSLRPTIAQRILSELVPI